MGGRLGGQGCGVPEGHLVHHIARDQAELAGRPVAVSSPQRRLADTALLDGRTLEAVEAYGKHLVHRFGDVHLRTHLGMQGRWARLAPPRPPRPQARVRIATPEVAWDLFAPSAAEVLDDDALATLLSRLGDDPLRPEADPDRVWARLRDRPTPIGAALLDQAVVAGVGNVLRAEALAAARIDPLTPSEELGRPRFDRLWSELVEIMERAAGAGKIATVDDLPEDEARLVYKQERCRRCGGEVRHWDLGGRTMWACPACQQAA